MPEPMTPDSITPESNPHSSDDFAPTLQIVVASTREGRQGPIVGQWFTAVARAQNLFYVEAVDLANMALPLLDEPRHPSLRQYEHEHTRRWSEIVARADAYVFVTPEYDYSAPASLINAIQYLSHEWAYKPAGFVSYGGVSGGTRGVQMSKQLVTAVKMMPMSEGVAIPFFAQYISPNTGIFAPGELQSQSAIVMLTELHRWAVALKPMRNH